jgi:hypothetical protein
LTFVGVNAAGGDYIASSQKAAASGVASLDAGGKLVLAQSPTVLLPVQNTTSGTFFDFAIPAGAKRVVVNCNAISVSGFDGLLFQMNGEVTGYSGVTGVISTNNATFESTAGIPVWANGAGDAFSGEVSFNLMDAATNRWSSAHSGRVASSAVATGGGTKALAAALNSIRLTRSGTDTFDGGSASATVYF